MIAELRSGLVSLILELGELQRSHITDRAEALLALISNSVDLVSKDYKELRTVSQLRARNLLIHHLLALRGEITVAVYKPNRTSQSAVILRTQRLLRLTKTYVMYL